VFLKIQIKYLLVDWIKILIFVGQMRLNLYNSDFLGVLASTLCICHCLGTPFLFVAQANAINCCEFVPFWWKSFNFFFIFLSFFAIYYSARRTSKNFMKILFWSSWIALTALLLNELFELAHLTELPIYLASSMLVFLHFYNLKYCQCKDDECCIHDPK
tara:strand:- start:3635 stop:4111 length:477 start_codon:yes stop_codon:yes gene_type:complete